MVLPRSISDKLKGLYGSKYKWLDRKSETESNIHPNKQKRIPRQKKTFYRGFKFGSCEVYEGDCVFVKMSESHFEVNSQDEVARVVHCYDNGEKRDSMKLIIQWYSRADSIQVKHLEAVAKDIPPIDKDIEVMKNYWGYDKEIDAETVCGLCHVAEMPGDAVPSSVSRPRGAIGPLFICRFNYHIKKPWLSPLTAQDVTFPSPLRSSKKPLGNVSASALNILTPKSEKKHPPGSTQVDDQVWFDIQMKSPVVSIEKLPSQDINQCYTPLRKSVKRKLLDIENDSPKRPRIELNCDVSLPCKEDSEDPNRPYSLKENQSLSSKPKEESLVSNCKTAPVKETTDNPISLSTVKTLGSKSVLRVNEISMLMAEDDDFEKSTLFRSPKVEKNKSNSTTSSKKMYFVDEESTPTSRRKIIKSRRYSESEFVSPNFKVKKQLNLEKAEDKKTDVSSLSLKEISTHGKTPPNSKSKIKKGALCIPEKKSKKRCPSFKLKEKSKVDNEDLEVDDRNRPLNGKEKTIGSNTNSGVGTPKGKLSKSFVSSSPLTKPSPKTPKAKNRRNICPSPAVPGRSTPVAKVKGQLEHARNQLHVSVVPSYLPCREEEFEQIYSFVEGKLADESGGCMYVSGVPGTGKTATVREVVKLIQEQQVNGSLPDFHMLEINAMKLSSPQQLWVQVWEGLMNEKVTADHARALLDKFFSCSMPKTKCVCLMLDELDLLWTRKQDVMYNLFDWSSRIGSKLIVVAIANTMDLPERMMMSRVSSRLGLTRMTFQPYTYNQLKEIIESRLKGIEAFDPDAIQYVSRKVAAVLGDARRALDICRRATEIAERVHSGTLTIKSPLKSPRKKKKGVVSMEHVSAAIEEMFTSPKVKAIKCCSKMEKYVLRAILAEFLRTGLEEATFRNVLIQLDSINRFEGVSPPSSSEALSLINHLSALRIILSEHSRLDFLMRIRLNVSPDDVSYALQD